MAEEDEIDKLTSSWNSHDRWAIMRRLAEIARAERVRASQLATALQGMVDAWDSCSELGLNRNASPPFRAALDALAGVVSSTRPEATKGTQ